MHGKPTPLIPAAHLDKTTRTQIRQPTVEPEKATDKKTQARDVMDLMRAVNNYAFLVCVCGLKMKLPPNLPDKKISCPKCGRDNEVPVAELAAIGAMVAAAETADTAETAHPVEGAPEGSRRFEYTRKGTGWETFSCACGKLLQMSPAFTGSHLTCKTCRRTTRIKH
jgi:heat shock protein HtpX